VAKEVFEVMRDMIRKASDTPVLQFYALQQPVLNSSCVLLSRSAVPAMRLLYHSCKQKACCLQPPSSCA